MLCQRIERPRERCRVGAARGDPSELQLRREVSGSGRERVEQALCLGVVRRPAEPLDLLRQRVRRLEVGRVQLDRTPPVAHGCLEMAGAAFGQRQQAFDRGVARRQLRGSGQAGRGLVHLLLPQQQQSEVGPPGGLVWHELREPIQLLPRVHVLAGLHRGQRHVERRHRLAVDLIGHARPAPAPACGHERRSQRAGDDQACDATFTEQHP